MCSRCHLIQHEKGSVFVPRDRAETAEDGPFHVPHHRTVRNEYLHMQHGRVWFEAVCPHPMMESEPQFRFRSIARTAVVSRATCECPIFDFEPTSTLKIFHCRVCPFTVHDGQIAVVKRDRLLPVIGRVARSRAQGIVLLLKRRSRATTESTQNS